jgi:hypothetical protein
MQYDLDARRLHRGERRHAHNPRSHTWRCFPEPGVTDSVLVEELVTGSAGTVVVMNTHMWHGGTASRTDRCRRALHVFYMRNDKPQQQYQKALWSATMRGASSYVMFHLAGRLQATCGRTSVNAGW